MDINKVRDVLSKKKIVLLGESAHGIKEQNNNRVELIKKLHQEEGFNLLFIESVKPSKGLSSYSIANDFVRNELHEVYHTEEVLELVEYALNCNLELRGFELYDEYLDEYYKNSFKFFAIGDDVKNDLEPWKKEYKAETYLINNKSDSDFVDFQLSIEDSLEKIVNQT